MEHAGYRMPKERSALSRDSGRTFHEPSRASGDPGRIAGPRLPVDHGPVARTRLQNADEPFLNELPEAQVQRGAVRLIAESLVDVADRERFGKERKRCPDVCVHLGSAPPGSGLLGRERLLPGRRHGSRPAGDNPNWMSNFAFPALERPVQLQSLELGLIPRLDHLHRAPPLLREACLCTFVFVLDHTLYIRAEGRIVSRGLVAPGEEEGTWLGGPRSTRRLSTPSSSATAGRTPSCMGFRRRRT